LRGALEGYANFHRQAERNQRIGMRRLKTVSATETHQSVTAGGVTRCCELTFSDGVIGHVLSIVDAAEKLVGLAIARICGEYLPKARGCFINTTLLKKRIGPGRIGN